MKDTQKIFWELQRISGLTDKLRYSLEPHTGIRGECGFYTEKDVDFHELCFKNLGNIEKDILKIRSCIRSLESNELLTVRVPMFLHDYVQGKYILSMSKLKEIMKSKGIDKDKLYIIDAYDDDKAMEVVYIIKAR